MNMFNSAEDTKDLVFFHFHQYIARLHHLSTELIKRIYKDNACHEFGLLLGPLLKERVCKEAIGSIN